MTRQECEVRLLQLAEDAQRAYLEYNGTSGKTLFITTNHHGINIEDSDRSIHVFKTKSGYVECTGFWRKLFKTREEETHGKPV